MRCGLVIGMAVMGTPCLGQMFQGLGVVPGRSGSTAYAISSNGSTVVGGSGPTPWRWTLASGLQTFGAAPTGFSFNPATDVSADGSTIVGYMNDGVGVFAWRWNAASGVQRVVGVGGAPGPYVSADGSMIVGTAEGTSLSAVRWTQSTGVQSLNPVTGLPFGNGSATTARGVSANGSVVVGAAFGTFQLNPPQQAATPYQWTQASGSVAILNNGQFYFPLSGAGATDISADGSAVVGNVGLGSFLWTAQSGYQLISNDVVPPGQGLPQISGDGTTLVYKWHFWTQSSGLQRVSDVLASAGCDYAGWSNLIATDVAYNGRTLCGYGTNPVGQTEAWYATIPAPSSALAMIAVCVAASTRRRVVRG